MRLMKKLEVYYLANKSENIYFALLGDCTASKNENEDFDNDVIKEGLEQIDKLNKKYNKNFEKDYSKFNFLYRKRIWNSREKCYLGWERKRGLLCQFNEFILKGENPFRVNTISSIERSNNEIKYVITLDADTNLILESGLELIGAMSHILNKPVLDKNENIVIDGYGLMQPRIGVDLKESRKSIFSKLYSGLRRDRFIFKCYF